MLILLSFGFGLLAWGLGIAAIRKKGCPRCVLGSMASCGISLVLQLWEIARRAQIPDFPAIQDTAPTVASAAAVLLIVAVLLNGIALLRGK